MMAIVSLFVAAFVLGMLAGIAVGWSAAPALVWQAPKEGPGAAPAPQAVGVRGGL